MSRVYTTKFADRVQYTGLDELKVPLNTAFLKF